MQANMQNFFLKYMQRKMQINAVNLCEIYKIYKQICKQICKNKTQENM